MDNFSIDITAEESETLLDVLKICFRHNAPGGKATHWIELDADVKPEWAGASSKRKTLVLLSSEENKTGLHSHKMITPVDASGAYEVVSRWLLDANLGPEPSHDGSNGKGFRAHCNFWGHVDGFHCAIVGITPAWAMYGK